MQPASSGRQAQGEPPNTTLLKAGPRWGRSPPHRSHWLEKPRASARAASRKRGRHDADAARQGYSSRQAAGKVAWQCTASPQRGGLCVRACKRACRLAGRQAVHRAPYEHSPCHPGAAPAHRRCLHCAPAAAPRHAPPRLPAWRWWPATPASAGTAKGQRQTTAGSAGTCGTWKPGSREAALASQPARCTAGARGTDAHVPVGMRGPPHGVDKQRSRWRMQALMHGCGDSWRCSTACLAGFHGAVLLGLPQVCHSQQAHGGGGAGRGGRHEALHLAPAQPLAWAGDCGEEPQGVVRRLTEGAPLQTGHRRACRRQQSSRAKPQTAYATSLLPLVPRVWTLCDPGVAVQQRYPHLIAVLVKVPRRGLQPRHHRGVQPAGVKPTGGVGRRPAHVTAAISGAAPGGGGVQGARPCAPAHRGAAASIAGRPLDRHLAARGGGGGLACWAASREGVRTNCCWDGSQSRCRRNNLLFTWPPGRVPLHWHIHPRPAPAR